MPQLLLVIPADDPVQIKGSPQLDRLTGLVNIRLYDSPVASKEEQLARCRGATIVINSRGHVHWSEAEFSQLPDLQMITTCSIGIDAIDVPAARARGIVVCNVPGRTAAVVAEHALALLLAAARRLAFTTANLKRGGWKAPANTFLRGKTLGVVGTGAIGAQMVALGKAIGMRVQAWTFHPSAERAEQLGVPFVDFETLLTSSDAISLHVRLTPDSRHLIDRRALAKMRPGSILVNTARGPVVDTAGLVDSLLTGHIGSAGIDVFDDEPISAGHPLLACEQVVLSPHSADQNPEGIDLLNGGAVDNVLAFLAGKPRNVV